MTKIPEIKEKIKIPDNVEVKLENNNVNCKRGKRRIIKSFFSSKNYIKIDDKIIEI